MMDGSRGVAIKKMWEDFKNFIRRGSMLDMAVGFSVGTAFTTLVKSLVDNMIMPPVGLLVGMVDFSNQFIVLREGRVPGPYASLQAANDAGATTLRYGLVVNSAVSFLIVALVVFFMIKIVTRLLPADKPGPLPAPTTKACPYCRIEIPIEATRCPHCTSQIELGPAVKGAEG